MEMTNMHKMNVIYESKSGNTKHFVNLIQKLFHNLNIIQVSEQSDLFKISKPFFCFVPTYVHGYYNQYHEVETLDLNDELQFNRNYRNCLGFIGSGNRNFGIDCFCWTAKHYTKKFNKPLISKYELRGNVQTANQIEGELIKIWHKKTGQMLNYEPKRYINPRLAKLKKKYSHNYFN